MHRAVHGLSSNIELSIQLIKPTFLPNRLLHLASHLLLLTRWS